MPKHVSDYEFSRPLNADQVGAEPLTRSITAKEAECAALAKRFGVTAIRGFAADLTCQRIDDGKIIEVAGRVMAEVEQPCAISLEPVQQKIDEPFSALLAEENVIKKLRDSGEVEEEDLPELITYGTVDLGEVAAQYLSLAIDPYPKKPGVAVPAQISAAPESYKPFAALAALKKTEKDK